MTTPISDNFETRIINELMIAQQSIKIAVAWFNSKSILNILYWKLKEGVHVELILHYDEINSGSESSLDFSEFKQLEGILIWAKGEKSTMHVKFCIIDDKVLLHGSCNWTYRAFKKNDEVLNVTTEEPEMINTYLSTFASLKRKYTSVATTYKKTNSTPCSSKKLPFQNTSKPVVNNPISIDERKLLFLQALQPFETKYDNDYIRTFTEYWLAENMGRLRIEVNENGSQMNLLGITPEYMDMKLEQWKRKYDIIVTARRSPFILEEIRKEANAIEKDYESKGIELRCNTAMDELYSFRPGNRLLGKILYDRGLFLKILSVHDSFLQTNIDYTLCCPIDSIEEKEQNAFTDFYLLYEATQAFRRNKEYNRAILSSIGQENTYKSFCDKYGIYYGRSLKKEKSIKDMIDSLEYPIKLEYHAGSIKAFVNRNGNQKRLLKLNEVFGLKLLTAQRSVAKYFIVPHKVLYQMDGSQFDFRDDSFENGTMKSVKLPTDYKDAQFYIDKIEEMLNRD
jgi:hypothetical protein